MVSLVCPDCHSALERSDSTLTCPKCVAHFPIVDEIPRFVPIDSFYEGKWATHDHSAGTIRNWLVKKERFFLTRLAGKTGTLLDLGCGGGWRLHTRAGAEQVVGVDLSQASLRSAARIYGQAVAADLGQLPFPHSSFDFVVSSDVIGHIPVEGKAAVLREIYRVLKPGGRTLHYIETDGDDPLTRFAKRYPESYRKHFVEPEGHIGMESSQQTAARFRAVGFKPIAEIPAYRMITYVHRMLQYFDNEYLSYAPALRVLTTLSRVLTFTKPVAAASNAVVSGILEVSDRVLPASWASGIMVEYEK